MQWSASRSTSSTFLSNRKKDIYEAKVVSAGLRVDPYAIEHWTETPEDAPDVHWSDMMLYMVSTPSPYTREEIKVGQKMYKCLPKNFIVFDV